MFTVAAAYALVGKICVANGGWGPVPVSEPAPAAPATGTGAAPTGARRASTRGCASAPA